MTLPGIDLSHYQDPTPSLVGLAFAFAKASEGLAVDSMYATHRANIRAAGLVTGAYHFSRADVSTPTMQAAVLVAAAGDVDLYALDVEGAHPFNQAQIVAFMAAIRARTSKPVLLYHSRSGFPLAAGQDGNWVADYNAGWTPDIPWIFWQYGPRVISGRAVDGDVFNGDQAALRALVGKDSMDPSIDIPIAVCDVAAGGTVYSAGAGGTVLIAAWAGAKNVGLYAQGGTRVPLRLNLGSAAAPRLVVGYVGADKVSNVRLAGAGGDLVAKRAGYDLAVAGAKITFPPRP